MGRDAAADLGLLADYHGLQDAGVAEAQGAGDGGVLGGDGGAGEGRVEVVQVVAYFVDGAVFGLEEGAVCVEGVCVEENRVVSGLIGRMGVRCGLNAGLKLPSSKKKRTLSPLSRK